MVILYHPDTDAWYINYAGEFYAGWFSSLDNAIGWLNRNYL